MTGDIQKTTGQDKNWFDRHRVLTVVGVLFILGFIASAASGDPARKPESVANTPATTESTPKPEPAPEPPKPDVPTEHKSALSKAEYYANGAHMSKKGVYDQLTSEYGEKFSPEAAQYAIDNVKADWNANALAKAKSYQDNQHMSPAAVRDQLVSEYGEKFTAAEADYAVAHLND